MKKKHQRFIMLAMLCAVTVTVQAQSNQLLNLPLPEDGLRYHSFDELEVQWPSGYGENHICLWGDDKIAAVSFTIDDNIPQDVSFWRQASADYGWKFTWFIIVYPYLWDIYNNQSGSNITGFGPVGLYKTLYEEGHEIELHGHGDSMVGSSPGSYEEEALLSKAYIESVVGNNITTFAYPNGATDGGDGSGAYREVMRNHMISARGTLGGPTPVARVDYLQTRSMGSAVDISSAGNWPKLEDKTGYVFNYSYYHGWAVVLNHKISDQQATLAMLDYVKTNEYKYWVKPYSYVARYAQERESGTVTVTQVTSDRIVFTLTDRMKDDIFNVPLTVKFCVDGWNGASAVQDGHSVPVRMTNYNGSAYALVDAVPDQGIVTLSKAGDAVFEASPVSGWNPLTVTFSDTSALTGITNRYWNFGDGFSTNTTGSAVSHTYTVDGNYTVQLIVSGSGGIYTNTQTGLISLSTPLVPSAGFSMDASFGMAPLTVSFTDISSGNITNRCWDFGDGATTNTAATGVSHTYLSQGTNAVSLIVTGPAGASTNVQFVAVNEPASPVAGFSASPASGAAPLTVTFTDESTGVVTNRYWNFGDGGVTNTTAVSVIHVYTAPGTSTVTLIAGGYSGVSTNSQPGLICVASVVSGGPVHLDLSGSYNYDAFVTGDEITYATGQGLEVKNAIGDHAVKFYTVTARTGIAHLVDPSGAHPGIAANGVVDGGNFELAKGLTTKFGTASGDTKVNNSIAVLPDGVSLSFSKTITLAAGDQQKYSDLNLLVNGDRKLSAGSSATLSVKYAGDDIWYTVWTETAAANTAGGCFGGTVDGNATYSNQSADWTQIATDTDGTVKVAGGLTVASSGVSYMYKFTSPVLLDSTKVLESFKMETTTSNKSYVNDFFLYAATATAVSGTVPLDGNGNGIPDAWENQYGIPGGNPDALAANGINTIREAYIAGLDPTNAQSVLTISGSPAMFRWNAVSGRVYSVWWTTNLLEGFQCLESNILWPQNSWTGQVNGADSGEFYQIQVRID